jgi:hypothetical protein
MAEATVTLVQTGVQVVSAALYLWVARTILTRDLAGDTRRANTLFGVWWLALGSVFLLAPLFTLPSRLGGYENLALSITLLNLLLILIVVAAWGLAYYLTYLYTGNPRWFWPITAFYVVLGILLLYAIAWLNPVGFDATGRLAYEHESLPRAPAMGISLLFSLPILTAALAYGSLFFRVNTTEARYRIAMVSGGFILQFGWSLVSGLLQLSRRFPDAAWLPFISNAFGIIAAIAVLLAFRPPRMLRERWGLRHHRGGT